MENATLHEIKTNICPKCEVPPYELGTGANHHLARNYATRNEHYERLGIKTGPNIFQGLERVSAPDLHMPDLLHTIYLGLFKHMMDWIQGFLMFTTYTGPGVLVLDSFETRQAGMIVFGYGLVAS